MAIDEAINELGPLAEKYFGAAKLDSELIRTLLYENRVGSIHAKHLLRKPSVTNLCHGDFHGRNILVQVTDSRPTVRIIDLASMGFGLWCTDTVRLMVDLTLSGWDFGSASYEWDNVKSWLEAADILIDGLGEPTSGAKDNNQNIRAALRWLRTNRFAANKVEAESYRDAEYRLALAVEFLRGAYRSLDVTAPKRTFSLIAASRVLRAAEAAFSG